MHGAHSPSEHAGKVPSPWDLNECFYKTTDSQEGGGHPHIPFPLPSISQETGVDVTDRLGDSRKELGSAGWVVCHSWILVAQG